MKRIFTAILLGASFFCSCSKPEQPEKGGKVAFDAEQVVISADAGKAVINIEADADWYIQSKPEWLSYIKPSSGTAGRHELTVGGRFYEGSTQRSGKVVAVCSSASAEFEVVQLAKSSLVITPSEVKDFPAEGGYLEITVGGAADYKVEVREALWIAVGSKSATKTVLAIAANDAQERSAEVRFSPGDGSAAVVLSITQKSNAAHLDMMALKALYESTGGESWTKKDGWNSTRAISEWYGVSCNAEGRVVGLNLSGNNLVGQLPDELSNLTELEELHLNGNLLSGSLPKGIRLLKGWSGFSAGTNIFPQKSGFGLSTTDGEVVQYMKSSKSDAVDIVILGDAYDGQGLRLGSGFDALVDKTITALFSIEPMNSLKEYFNVYTVSALSGSTEISTAAGNTAFGTYFISASFSVVTMNTDSDKVIRYAGKAPIKDLRNTVVILLVNTPRFGGTTLSWPDGSKHLSIIPDYRGGQSTVESQYGFEGLVHHEAIGHALAFLDEEYHVNGKTADAEFAVKLAEKQGKGLSMNISSTSNPATVPWAAMIGKKGCESVGVFEGAGDFTYGAYRSADKCCMVDNRPDFSMWCRYLIWSRVLGVAGEPCALDDYLKTL